MINTVQLWHITPFDIGLDFWNPTQSSIVVDKSFYRMVNLPTSHIDESMYTESDLKYIKAMRTYLADVRNAIHQSDNPTISSTVFVSDFPDIIGCIAKFILSIDKGHELSCHIMHNGTGVFLETGGNIEVDDKSHFSIPLFYERQIIEDDYYTNPKDSPRKRTVYAFIKLLWACAKTKDRPFSASGKYKFMGVPYTLPITVVDIPDFQANSIDDQLKRNIRAIIDTSAFSNILQKEQWQAIKRLVDENGIEDIPIKELSESLVYADGWSGVVIVGNIAQNSACIKNLINFDIYLQSFWVLYDAYSEEVVRRKIATINLQKLINELEYSRVIVDNDIVSNIEQSKLSVRRSLIESSDIDTIYNRAHGLMVNRLKIQIMEETRKRRKYSLVSEIALFIIALLQIYDVVRSFFNSDATLLSADYITLTVFSVISIIGIIIMIKGS